MLFVSDTLSLPGAFLLFHINVRCLIVALNLFVIFKAQKILKLWKFVLMARHEVIDVVDSIATLDVSPS